MVWWCLSQNDATKKKSKDRERRKSLIQAITGLFSNKKDEPKEAESSPTKKAKETAKSPSLKDKFPLLKLSPKKDKFKVRFLTDLKSYSSSFPLVNLNDHILFRIAFSSN